MPNCASGSRSSSCPSAETTTVSAPLCGARAARNGLTASAAARAQRRLLELQGKSVKADYDEVLRDIEYRDKQDTSRATAPLKAAEDAVRVDTSDIDFEQSAALLRSIVRERLGV